MSAGAAGVDMTEVLEAFLARIPMGRMGEPDDIGPRSQRTRTGNARNAMPVTAAPRYRTATPHGSTAVSSLGATSVHCRKVCHAQKMTPREHSVPKLSLPKDSVQDGPRASVPGPDGSHASLAGDLSFVARSLHEQYDSHLGSAVVDSEVQQVADRFTNARIRTFVPLFVRRFAGANLRKTSLATAGMERD